MIQRMISPTNRLTSIAIWVGLLASLLALRPSSADVVLGGHDWDPTGVGLWTNRYGSTTLDTPSTGGQTGGFLQVTFPETLVPESSQTGWYDVVYTKATNLYTGTWTTDMWVQMDFWASNIAPGAVQVQWQSTSNADIWGYSLTTPGTGWTSLAASFMNWTNWQYAGATEAQYLSDLASIDWIGVYIYRNSGDVQIYGLDDFDLMVPEPAEVLLLALALTMIGLSLYRRRVRPVVPSLSTG